MSRRVQNKTIVRYNFLSNLLVICLISLCKTAADYINGSQYNHTQKMVCPWSNKDSQSDLPSEDCRDESGGICRSRWLLRKKVRDSFKIKGNH